MSTSLYVLEPTEDLDRWYSVEKSRWDSNRLPQPPNKPYCYAASVASVLRYVTDTTITVEDIVKYMYGRRDTMSLPGYYKYKRFLHALQNTGIQFRRRNDRVRRGMLVDVQQINFVDHQDVHDFLAARRRGLRLMPMICTIRRENDDHDLVITGIRTEKVNGVVRVQVIKWWNPADDGTWTEDFSTFVAQKRPTHLVALFPYPEMPFEKPVTTFRLTVPLSETFNPLFRVGIGTRQITVAIEHWPKFIRTKFIRVEQNHVILSSTTDLVATRDRAGHGPSTTPIPVWIQFGGQAPYAVEVTELDYEDD